MSFVTGTNCELLYSNTAIGAVKSNFTSEAQINDAASMGTQPVISGFFFQPNASSAGKTIKIVARGIVSSTGTPNFGINARLNTAINTITGPIALGSSPIAGPPTVSGASNLAWVFDGDFFLVAPKEPTGANSSILGVGNLGGAAFTANGSLFANAATNPTTALASIDIGQAYYITISATCSAASASNTITLQQLLVYGLN